MSRRPLRIVRYLRWPAAALVALFIVFWGARCVDVASGLFLDPLWNAPLEDVPEFTPPRRGGALHIQEMGNEE